MKNARNSLKILILSASLAFVALPAQAQFGIGGALYNQPMDYMYYNAQSDIYRRTFESHNKAFGTSSRSSAKARQPQKNPRAYQYTFSQSESDRFGEDFIQAMLEQARKNNTLDAVMDAKIREMQTWNYVSFVRDTIHSKGHNPDSIAMALAFWLAVNYGTINQIEGSSLDTTRLQNELEIAMSRDADLLAASDAEKQRMAENLLWLALVQIIVQEEAGSDTTRQQAAADQGRANLKAYGINPDQVSLGSEGLLLK